MCPHSDLEYSHAERLHSTPTKAGLLEGLEFRVAGVVTAVSRSRN